MPETCLYSKGPAPLRKVRVLCRHRVWWRSGSGTKLLRETVGWEYRYEKFIEGAWRRCWYV